MAWTFAAFGAVLAVAVGIWSGLGAAGGRQLAFEWHTVSRSDLPIVITERGTVGAQSETLIRCEVDSMTDTRRWQTTTPVIFLVKDGTRVTKGDLILEFESTFVREHLNQHELRLFTAVATKIRAHAQYTNRILQNETNQARAKLLLQLSEMRLGMYLDEQNGTYQLAREDLMREIQEKQAALNLAQADAASCSQLFELGYRGRGQLELSRFRRLQAEDALKAAEAKQKKLLGYDNRMSLMRLKGAVESAKRDLHQVANDNAAALIQAESFKHFADISEERERTHVERLKLMVEKCKVYAPHDGVALYVREGRHGETEVRLGMMALRWQSILTLPDLSKMQIAAQVHESLLDQLRPGLPVRIRIDALPSTFLEGTVHEVAVLPTFDSFSFTSSGVRTYKTTVRLAEEVPGLQPGMTAVLDIQVDPIRNAFTIPVQAVVQVDRENWCYVDSPQGPTKRPLRLGRSNGRSVQVQEGLSDGDRVVLNPATVPGFGQDQMREISPVGNASDVPLVVARKEDSSDRSPPENRIKTATALTDKASGG